MSVPQIVLCARHDRTWCRHRRRSIARDAQIVFRWLPRSSGMRRHLLGVMLVASIATVLWPPIAQCASVHPLFNLSSPSGGPFPSDRFTVPDASQNTGERVALPKPDCAARPSDCADLDVLDELDGFNMEPRLSIPFDGSIDLGTATSGNIVLVSLGSTLPGGEPAGHISGIDQIVWDSLTTTLHVESDELLDQHTRYALVVTKDVHDPAGKEIKAAKEFIAFVDETITASTGSPALDVYRTLLRNALSQLDSRGIVARGRVVAASVFTTLSATANLEKMRDQIKAGTPAAANFMLGPGGSRAVFALSSVTRVVANRDTSANPAAALSNQVLPLQILKVVPGIGSIAFGKYVAPDYRVHPGEYIPPVGTLTGTPLVQGFGEITFLLFLPSSPKPTGGYPVAIWGHGGGTANGSSGFVAAELAKHGIATIAINAPGSGFGPRSATTLSFTDHTPVMLPSGGRGFDQNGDGIIDDGEGSFPVPSKAILGRGRGDFHWQCAAEHMQLVRVIEVGMDVDGDGVPDLDPSRIYYLGPSRGATQGAVFLAVEPNVRAGVLSVPGGPIASTLTAYRGDLGVVLQSRVPSLINPLGITSLDGISESPPYFNENLPLPDQAPFSVSLQDGSQRVVRSPQVNSIAGAMEIQEVLERAEWASQLAGSDLYASYLRRHPLPGVSAKSVIVLLAFGDRSSANPSTSGFLRAGDLADRATFFRTDLAFPNGNPMPFPNDPNLYPHAFLQIPPGHPAEATRMLQAQEQIASFFALDGTSHALDPFDGTQFLDPDSVGPIFETPIVLPLPAGLNYPLSGSLAVSFPSDAAPLATEPASMPGERDELRPRAPLAAWPVPYVHGTLHISLATDGREAVSAVDIYNLAGRHVRRIVGGGASADRREMTWDGRDERGIVVPSGVYLLRAGNGGTTKEAKIVVER